jgi:hypothetical protein
LHASATTLSARGRHRLATCAYQKTDLVEFQVDNRLLNERPAGLDVRRWSCFQTRERPSRIPAAIVGGFAEQRFGPMSGSTAIWSGRQPFELK